MLNGQNQRQLITGVGHHLQQLIQFSGELPANDRQIDLTIGNAPSGAPSAVHVQLHRNIWEFLTEQSDHPRHQIGTRRLAGAHEQGAAFEVMQVVKRTACLMALAEDSIAIAEEKMARLGELCLASTAVKQRNLKLFLEILDLEAHSRLGHIKAVSSLLEASLADDGSQDAQLIQSERQIGHGELP